MNFDAAHIINGNFELSLPPINDNFGLFQGSIYDWVRIHRLHHQTFKTSDDPFYSDKDFLHAQVFAHIRKLSPRQEKLLETVNMKDIEEDGLVMFQKRSVTLVIGTIKIIQ